MSFCTCSYRWWMQWWFLQGKLVRTQMRSCSNCIWIWTHRRIWRCILVPINLNPIFRCTFGLLLGSWFLVFLLRNVCFHGNVNLYMRIFFHSLFICIKISHFKFCIPVSFFCFCLFVVFYFDWFFCIFSFLLIYSIKFLMAIYIVYIECARSYTAKYLIPEAMSFVHWHTAKSFVTSKIMLFRYQQRWCGV